MICEYLNSFVLLCLDTDNIVVPIDGEGAFANNSAPVTCQLFSLFLADRLLACIASKRCDLDIVLGTADSLFVEVCVHIHFDFFHHHQHHISAANAADGQVAGGGNFITEREVAGRDCRQSNGRCVLCNLCGTASRTPHIPSPAGRWSCRIPPCCRMDPAAPAAGALLFFPWRSPLPHSMYGKHTKNAAAEKAAASDLVSFLCPIRLPWWGPDGAGVRPVPSCPHQRSPCRWRCPGSAPFPCRRPAPASRYSRLPARRPR